MTTGADMAKPSEKQAFIDALYELQQTCNSKSNDGTLTEDQRSVFITASIYLTSDIGRACDKDFSPVPSDKVQSAIQEVKQATTATSAAHDDFSVQVAAKDLWDANTAIDLVLD